MIQKRRLVITLASLLAMSGASAVLARSSSDEAAHQGAESASSMHERWADANPRGRWRDERRWRSSWDWDALVEFDRRVNARSGRLYAGPRLRNLDEGSGSTYRERFYDPYGSPSRYVDYMDRNRFREPFTRRDDAHCPDAYRNHRASLANDSADSWRGGQDYMRGQYGQDPRNRSTFPTYLERDDPVRVQTHRLRGRSVYDVRPAQGLTNNPMRERDWRRQHQP